jgi:two-component system response regulator VicR
MCQKATVILGLYVPGLPRERRGAQTGNMIFCKEGFRLGGVLVDIKKILVVEDDQTIGLGLEYSLRQEGFFPTVAENAAAARSALSSGTFDLILLDLSLPDGNGFELCKLVRSLSDTPVIFLTANDDEVSVVMALDMGADDYITKPFRIRELISRIKTVLRRAERSAPDQTVITVGRLSVNTALAKVYKDGQEVLLTALEYRLLLILMGHAGQVLSRGQILEGIWDVAGDYVNDNTLTVYIKRLREKIEDDPQNPAIIKTVRGIGYQL